MTWTVTNWYSCSWHTFWRMSWPVFMQASVVPDLQVIYFSRDVKCHLITWRFITASSVATFGVTLKKGHAISLCVFHLLCSLWLTDVNGLMVSFFFFFLWLVDVNELMIRQLFLCILNMHYCLLQTVWKLLSSVCKTLFTYRSFGVFAIADIMVFNKTLVPTKNWWFAWWIPLGILSKVFYCHARFSLMKSSHTKCLFWTRCHFALLMIAAPLMARMHCNMAA